MVQFWNGGSTFVNDKIADQSAIKLIFLWVIDN